MWKILKDDWFEVSIVERDYTIKTKRALFYIANVLNLFKNCKINLRVIFLLD